MKALRAHDSLMAIEAAQKDSSLMAYIRTISEIQNSIDTLKMQAGILKEKTEMKADTGTIVADIRAVGNLIIRNNRALSRLEVQLRSSDKKNAGLTSLMEHLSKELNEKDTEIVAIQRRLAQTNSSLLTLINQFNDSINTLAEQRAEIGRMQTEINTVYYTIGTEKELKKAGVITKKGGFIGIGRVATLSQDMNKSEFNSADLTNLREIPLGGKFVKLVTSHPSDSYKITSSSAEKLVITDPATFWSQSKYLVAVIK